jgi:hypothetical protein
MTRKLAGPPLKPSPKPSWLQQNADLLLDKSDEFLFWGPILALGILFLDYRDRLTDQDVLSPTCWTIAYVVGAPIHVWRVGRRQPPGDRWRSAATLAIGGLPCALLLIPGSVASGWPWLGVCVVLAVLWGLAAQFMALRTKPPPQPKAIRIISLGVGAIISGLIALPLFAGAGIGLLMGIWEPPPLAWLFSPVIIGLCLPAALLMAYGSLGMFREAMRTSAAPSTPAPP